MTVTSVPWWKVTDADGLSAMAVEYCDIARLHGDYVTYAEALDVAYRLTGTPYPAGIAAS